MYNFQIFLFQKIANITCHHSHCFSHVLSLFAETRVVPSFKINSQLNLLQESQAGIMCSPETLLLITCAPNVAELLHPKTEHFSDHDFPEQLIQCCFH